MVEKTELTDTGTFRSSSNFYSSSNKKRQNVKNLPRASELFLGAGPKKGRLHIKMISFTGIYLGKVTT